MAAVSADAKNHIMTGIVTPLLEKLVKKRTFALPKDINNETRVLIIDSGDLTEILFFSPVIDYLKQQFPGMRMTFLVREGNSELVRSMNHVSEMISYEPSHLSVFSSTYFSLIKRIRHKDFSLVFLLGKEFKFPRSLLAVLTRAAIRIGYSQEFNFPFINCELRRQEPSRYEADRATDFLRALGIRCKGRLPAWQLMDQDLRWAQRMIHFRKPKKEMKLIAVDPGRGMGRHRLVDESFSFLVNNLIEQQPAKVLVMSNNLDKKGIDRFKSFIPAGLLDLEPKNIKEALALLSCADLLLSGNTDYFHFGIHMRIPTIGLFTRYDNMNWVPKNAPWVQIIQGVKGQTLSLDEFFSKVDTLLRLTGGK